MNADETVKELCWLSKNDEWVFAAETMAKAADLIESLQSQLAEAKRRTEKALGYIKKIFGCDDCVHNDDTNYETCKSCNIYDKWQWRGDAEEGENETTVAYFTLCKDNELGDVYKCASCGNEMYGNMPKCCSECGKRIVEGDAE